MRVFRIVALLAASVLATTACARRPASFTILHVNDLSDIEAGASGHAGGLARLATLRVTLLETAPPVLTTLGGTHLSPTVLGTARVDGQPLAGRQMVDVLNRVGLDWATLGSPAFDLPETAFHQRLAEQRFQVVSSNVTDANGYIFDGTVRSSIVSLHTRARDLRVGLIGLTAETTVRPWVRYRSPIDAARSEVARLRSAGSLDAVIALTDEPLADDEALASAIDDIDVVLGGRGRDNRVIRGGRRGIPIVRADANAKSAAVVTLTFDRGDGRPTVAVRIEPLNARIVPDPSVQALADQWRARAVEGFRAEGFSPEAQVTTLSTPLDARAETVRSTPNQLTELIGKAMLREAAGADGAIFESRIIGLDDMLPKGPLTEFDIIRLIPSGPHVVKVSSCSGELLERVLDQGAGYRGTGKYLQMSGIAKEADGWRIGGRPISPAGRYTIAMTDSLVSGSVSGFDSRSLWGGETYPLRNLRDIRHAVIEEFRRRGPSS